MALAFAQYLKSVTRKKLYEKFPIKNNVSFRARERGRERERKKKYIPLNLIIIAIK